MTQAIEDAVRALANNEKLTEAECRVLTDAWNLLGSYRAALDRASWRPIDENTPRDETAILLRFAPGCGFEGVMLCWFDKDNPKGNPWRAPLCDAWFGESLFDAWQMPPPVEHRSKSA